MTSKMTDKDVTCITCGQSGPAEGKDLWHPYQHPVKTENDREVPNVFNKQRPSPERQNGAEAQVSVVQSSMPFDPVLRQALLNKGVLTPQDLRDAEAMIAAVTGVMTQGVMKDVPSTG